MISDYLANKLLDHVLKNGSSYTAPAPVYVALLKAIPIRQTPSPASEVTGGSYARQSLTVGAAADAKSFNSAAVTFPSPTADWAPASAPIVAVALMDDSSSGNWLFAAPVCPFVVLNGDPAPTFKIGGILAAFASCFPG